MLDIYLRLDKVHGAIIVLDIYLMISRVSGWSISSAGYLSDALQGWSSNLQYVLNMSLMLGRLGGSDPIAS